MVCYTVSEGRESKDITATQDGTAEILNAPVGRLMQR